MFYVLFVFRFSCFCPFSFFPAVVLSVVCLIRGVPLVNIIESIDGEERFVTAVDTSGHKKDMEYLYTLIEPHICPNTDLIVSDGACARLLNIVEKKHPRYTAS